MIPMIFLLILLSVGLGEVLKTEPSDLQLLVDNFESLYRIANAIAIEALVAQKNISASIIISEYLASPYDNFKSVVDVDVGKLRLVMDFAEKSITARSKTYNDAFKRNVISFFGEIDVLLRDGSNVLEKAGRVSTENIFNEGMNINNSDIVNNDCLKLDTGNLNEFGKLFDMNNYWHLLPGNNYIEQVIYNFKNQSTTLLNCLNNMTDLAQSISSSTIWKAKAEYKDVEKMRQIAAKLIQFKLDKEFLNNIKGNMSAMLESDVKSMERYPSLNEAIMTFRQAMNNAKVQFAKMSHVKRHYTVGIYSLEDPEIIARDIKNPWFNRHFVKNATNANELKKVIYPFIKYSKKIRRIRESWFNFVFMFSNFSKSNEWNVFYDYLTILKEVYPTRGTISQRINDWKSLAENCIQLNYSNETLKKLADYERQQNAPLAIIRRISKLRSQVDKMNNQLHYELKYKKSALKHFERHFSFVLNVTHSKDGPFIDRLALKDLIFKLGDDANTFIRTVKIATKLAENLQKLKKESESLKRNITIIKLDEILEMMNLTNAVKCINNEGFNITFVFDWYRKYLEMAESQIGRFYYTKQYVDGLVNLSTSTSVFDSYMQHSLNDGKRNQQAKYQLLNITIPLKLVNTLVVGVKILRDMEKVRSNESDLLKIGPLTRYETNALKEFGLDEWQNMTELLKSLIHDADKMNLVAGTLRNATISNVIQIFLIASSIKGIPGTRANFKRFYRKMYLVSPKLAEKKFKFLYDLHVELDFASQRDHLIKVPEYVNHLVYFFDDFFERKKKAMEDKNPFTSIWIKIISACLGVIVLIVLGLLVYGLTESGRKNCRNLYLYYFVNWEVFEKRWRYSLFMDTIDMKNAILDAVRERNKANLLKALKSGAYINVYNKYGNTALHVATKTGLSDFVDILISYGADRSLLNVRNLTPEEMISPNFNKTQKTSQDASKFEAIQAIYKKHKKKTFRIAVPQVFPVNSFHIWMDENTDDKLTNAFMEKFPHITSDEAMPTTTHVIFHTDAGGIAEIDRLEQLIWIFHGAIIVKEQWMADCLKDPEFIEHDSDYLVEKLRFNGVVYDTVLQWTEAMAKGTMPYLCGAYVAAVMKECPYLPALNVIVTNQGGVMMPSFPVKDDFNIGSHPYLHANLGPLFLIHDGTIDLDQFKSDSDKMYTIFTKNEFIAFLLKRQINQDTRKNPPPVSKDDI